MSREITRDEMEEKHGDNFLEHLDYEITPGRVTVDVDESGSENLYSAKIKDFSEEDGQGRRYIGEVIDVRKGDYSVGDKVDIDNRDVQVIYK